jgi:DNA-binding SARP family transcriptional activator
VIGSQVSIRILGPVALVGRAGAIGLGGTLPRGVLAVLALESPRPVSVDRLASLLWGDDAPGGVKAAVQQLVSRLRRSLAAAGLGNSLLATPPGYSLDVAAGQIDVRVFRASVRAAIEAQRAGDHDDAAARLTAGLDLWVGDPLADLIELPLATLLSPGLDDERWRAEELRAVSLLAASRPDECAELLAAATAQSPLRERLWVLQARALAAAGRPADAVRCARTGIAVITAELGVPPGPELAALESEIPTLVPSTEPSTSTAPTRRVPGAPSALLDGALRRALANAEQAAVAASSRFASGEAVRQWQRAIELLDTVDPFDDANKLRLLLGLGEAHNTASRDSEARTTFREAAAIARRLGDHAGLAWATLGFCADRIGFAPPPEQTAMLEEALAGLEDGELLLRGRLLARLATELYWTGTVDRTLELAEAAYATAVQAGDDEGRLLAQYAMAFGCWTPDRTERLVKVCEDYLDDARATGDHRHQLLAHRWLVPAVTELGDVARGGHEAKLAVEMADELGLSMQQWISRVIAASHELLAGDLGRAESLATEGLALGSVAEPEVALDYVSLFIWSLRWLQGRLDEIVTLVEDVASTPGVDAARRLGLALTYGELGRVEDARAILDRITNAELDALDRNASWYISMAAAAEAAAACDHRRVAAVALAALEPYRERIAITSVTASGPVAHQVGIAAWTVGDHARGIRALTDSIALCDRVGAPLFGARSRIALAERLALTGDVQRARDLASAALAEAVSRGMVGIEQRAGKLLADT